MGTGQDEDIGMRRISSDGKLDPEVADTLYELGNVGVGKATSALGNMMGQRITIETPQVFSVSSDMGTIAGLAPDTIVMGIMMRLAENLGGVVMILLNKDFMTDLVYKLSGVHYSDDELIEDENSLSVIQEVANIMAASYMNAIGAYAGIRFYLTPVMVGVDMVQALISYPIAQMSLSEENIICIDTSFNVKEGESLIENCDGRIIMLPDDNSLRIIMEALGL